MRGMLAIPVLLVLIFSVNAVLAQQSPLVIADTKAEPVRVGLGGNVVISCRVFHPEGPGVIEAVAATAYHGNWVTTFPALYDDGTHGDGVAGDGVYSLEIQAAYGPGEEKIVFIAVDREGNEIESEPVILMIE